MPLDSAAIDALRLPFAHELRVDSTSAIRRLPMRPLPEWRAQRRYASAVDEIVEACDGCPAARRSRASLTADERREILRGMVLTRATDNRLKTFFTSGEVRYGETTFQGKGFRSLGQEAIYAAGIRLRRGASYRAEDGWRGDVVAPLIRDLGAEPRDADRAGDDPPGPVGADGEGRAADERQGPAHRRLRQRTASGDGAARESERSRSPASRWRSRAREADGSRCRFIGEGGSSLGEWHEAINLCAARRLPAVFCVQNNQTALSTPVRDQSAVRVFADKAVGYGIPGVTIDGTDPDEIAAAFAWAVERARAGNGPTLIELVSMRMCGHAHHDDMLYLGKEAQPSWTYPPLTDQGYADRELHAFWSAKDPIPAYAARLEGEGLITQEHLATLKREAEALVETQAQLVIAADWPLPADAGTGVLADEPPRVRVEVLDPAVRGWIRARSATPPGRRRTSSRQEREHVPRRRCTRHSRCASGRSTRLRLRRGRRREVRQRLPAASSAAGRIRRSHPQLDSGGRRRARRLHRRGAGRSAADWRDAVQRLRRERIQSAREQRREDPVQVGRVGTDGRAHAVGRPPARRAVP